MLDQIRRAFQPHRRLARGVGHVSDLTDRSGLDAVQPGDGSRRNVQTATGAPRFGHDFGMIEQRADADHHQIFARGEDFLRQFRHDGAAGGFDDQIGGGDQFDSRTRYGGGLLNAARNSRALFSVRLVTPAMRTESLPLRLLGPAPCRWRRNRRCRWISSSPPRLLVYREGFSAVNATAPANRASNKRSRR